jgi:steroid delta-isomerase-like uncharacterized protein
LWYSGLVKDDRLPKEIKMSVTQTTEKNKEIVRKIYEDCLNTGKMELLNQFVAEDYVGVAGQVGPEAFAGLIKELRQGFPDIQWTIEDLLAEGDRVVVRWKWQGAHLGAFRGFPVSQKKFVSTAIVIYQLKANKVVQAWMENDRLGFLQQMEVVPQDLGVTPQPQK